MTAATYSRQTRKHSQTNKNTKGSGDALSKTLTATFTTANSTNTTVGVASGLAGAVGMLAGTTLTETLSDIVTSLNDVAVNGNCMLAATTALSEFYFFVCLFLCVPPPPPPPFSPPPLLKKHPKTHHHLAKKDFFLPLREKNPLAAIAFMVAVKAKGIFCWTRRLDRIVASKVFAAPVASSPCSIRMREASAVSVAIATANVCGVRDRDAVQAAAYALVTAATTDACSFVTAVTTASMQGESSRVLKIESGRLRDLPPRCLATRALKRPANTTTNKKNLTTGLPQLSVVDVYTQAITQSGLDGSEQDLANAYVGAYKELLPVKGASPRFTQALLGALQRSVKVSGCSESLTKFVNGASCCCVGARAAVVRVVSVTHTN